MTHFRGGFENPFAAHPDCPRPAAGAPTRHGRRNPRANIRAQSLDSLGRLRIMA